VPKRFVNARAAFLRGDIATGGSDGSFYFRDRICRARRVLSEAAIEHRNVVMVIAGGENFFAGDFQKTR
jgi:hypothetical protein